VIVRSAQLRTIVPARNRGHRQSEQVGEVFLLQAHPQTALANLNRRQKAGLATESAVNLLARRLVDGQLAAVAAFRGGEVRNLDLVLPAIMVNPDAVVESLQSHAPLTGPGTPRGEDSLAHHKILPFSWRLEESAECQACVPHFKNPRGPSKPAIPKIQPKALEYSGSHGDCA